MDNWHHTQLEIVILEMRVRIHTGNKLILIKYNYYLINKTMSVDSWYTGEFAITRGFMTLILLIIIWWFLFQCYNEIKKPCKTLHRYCCYKTAKIEPTPEAIITDDTVNSYAKEISLKNIIIIN